MLKFRNPKFRSFLGAVFIATALFAVFSTGSQAADRAISFTYKGYSAGLLAARAQGTLDTTGERFLLSFNAGDAGISSLFSWASQIDASGVLTSQGVAPQRFNLQSRRKKRSSSRAITYSGGQASVIFGRPTTIPENEIILPSQTQGTVDPVSAFMATLNSIDQSGNCNFSIKVFEGKSLYRFDIGRVGIESISDRNLAYSGNATRCRITPVPLAGKAARPKDRAKLTAVDMWVAKPVAGGPMVPVKMTARVQGIPLTLLMTSVQ